MELKKITETSTTITLGWTPPAGVGGYVFYANGQVVSVATANLKDGSQRKEVKYSKTNPGPLFQVAATCRAQNGTISVDVGQFPSAPPLPPNVARSAATGVVQ